MKKCLIIEYIFDKKLGILNHRVKKVRITPEMIQRYFTIVHGESRNSETYGKIKTQLGTYCENCGILLGKDYINKDYKLYKYFFVCGECYSDLLQEKLTGEQLSAPNLNDYMGIK